MVSMVRLKEALPLFGVSKTKFEDHYIAKPGGEANIPGTDIPRLKLARLGPRSVALFSDEMEGVLEALRRKRDAEFTTEHYENSPSYIQAQHAAEASLGKPRKRRARRDVKITAVKQLRATARSQRENV